VEVLDKHDVYARFNGAWPESVEGACGRERLCYDGPVEVILSRFEKHSFQGQGFPQSVEILWK
jgi:hypothetical protein